MGLGVEIVTAVAAGEIERGQAVREVRLVTALAEALDLPEGEYRRMYDELREGRSLRAFATAIGSEVSFGWWAKYENGGARLDRERKNELRVAKGLPELPLSVVEAVAAGAHGDAAVWQVGVGLASRVVLVGDEGPGVGGRELVLRVNGAVEVVTDDGDQVALVGACNGRYRRAPRKQIHISPDVWERLNAARVAAGLGWDEFLRPLVGVGATDEQRMPSANG